MSDVEWCQNCGDVVTDDGCACAAIPKPTGVLTREQLEASCREYERLLEQKRATIEQQAQELERVKREFVNKDQIIASLAEQLTASQARCREMEERKDAAYLERNHLVAALAKCFPSGIAKTAIDGWSEDWHHCVYIDLPTGQVSWHYHDSHAHLFAGLPAYTKPWDGHSTEEKYARVAALNRACGYAAGRREAFQEVITRQTEVIRARETLMGLVAAPTMIEQAKVRNEECSTVRDWCAKAKEAGQ